MEFAAPAGALPPGWSRRFVLELVGWCKDMDFYTRDGATIEPLPARDPDNGTSLHHRDELHRRYNTRFRS